MDLSRNLFAEYRKYGGFPGVVLHQESEEKELLLKQYFEVILHREGGANKGESPLITNDMEQELKVGGKRARGVPLPVFLLDLMQGEVVSLPSFPGKNGYS